MIREASGSPDHTGTVRLAAQTHLRPSVQRELMSARAGGLGRPPVTHPTRLSDGVPEPNEQGDVGAEVRDHYGCNHSVQNTIAEHSGAVLVAL